MERRLAAILSSDVVGYSRLMGADEAGTLAALKAHRAELIEPKAAQYKGRTIKLMGDGALMEFPSVVEAVTFAVEVQLAMRERNRDLPEDRQILYRIGINIGDIIVEGDDIYGDGVNIAARLESLAEPGGICIRRNVRNQVRDKLDLEFEDRGEIEVKNIARPVRVFAVALDDKAAVLASPVVRETPRQGLRWWPLAAAAAALLIVAAGGTLWWQPWAPEFEPARAEAMALPLPDKPSIAVLAFDNMTGDTAQDYFSDGFAESLITELARDRELFVVARNSSFTYKGKPVEIRQVAEELGVRYVIEGSVQRSAGKLRIAAQLIDATAGNHVWAERYDRPADDLFAIQDEIVSSIVASVRGYRGSLQRAETERRAQSSTDDLGAHDLVLRGIMHKDRFTEADNKIAADLFRQAMARDPDYAAPYAWLAFTHSLDVYLGWSQDPAASTKAGYEQAKQAIKFDPALDVAHWALGTMHLLRGKADEGLVSFQKALELNPNNADIMADISWPLTAVGRAEEGIASVEKAMRLNPRHPEWYYWVLGNAFYFAGRYDDAVASFKHMTQQNLDTRLLLAASYARLGNADEAAQQVDAAVKLDPEISVETRKKSFPMPNSTVEDHYYEGLRLAGLPEQPPLKLPDKPSIAVLPFVNFSKDPGQEYFADGITEDLITDLARFPGLYVIARTTTSVYKGKSVDIREVSRELGVRYVLEGSVEQSADRVRVTAQLIDATSGGHLWAERFDRELVDIFAIRDEISTAIAGALTGHTGPLVKAEVQRALQRSPEKLAARDLYYRAYSFWPKFTKEANAQARKLLEKSIALDPGDAAVHALLAWTHWRDSWLEWGDDPDLSNKLALEAAQKAMALDATNYRSHWALGSALRLRGDFEAAALRYERAFELNPNDPDLLADWGELLRDSGQIDEAIAQLKRAMVLNPHYPDWYINNLTTAYFLAERHEESVQTGSRILNPVVSIRAELAASYFQLGQIDKAKAEVKKILQIDPDYSITKSLTWVGWDRVEDRVVESYSDALRQAGLPE